MRDGRHRAAAAGRRARANALALTSLALAVLPAAGAADPSEGAHATQSEPEDEIRVLGFRTGRIETPPSAFVSVIEAEDYENENKTLEDILAQQPGVVLRRFGGPGERSEITIRGSTGAQVGVELDGVPLNDAISGTTDPAQFCLGMIESVAIARGGGAGTEGSAIGGVVSLRSRRPAAQAVNRATTSGGAFGTWQGSAFRGAQAGPVDYTAGYCFFLTDGDYRFARPVFDVLTQTSFDPPVIERINNDRQRHSGSVSVGGQIGEHGYLVFRDYVTWTDHGVPGLDSQDGPTGGQNPSARQNDLHNIAQLEYRAEDLGAWGSALRASLWYRYQDNRYTDPGIDQSVQPIDAQTDVSTVGLDVSDSWQGSWLGMQHTLDVRANAKRESLFANDRPDQGRTLTGFGLQEDARLFDERLTLVPALRYEWAQHVGDRWLPGIGLVITPLPWLRIKSNVQRSWRVPSFDELYQPDKGFIRGNPDLRPESANNYDVGIEISMAALGPIQRIGFSGSVFLQEVDDSIVWIPISPFTIAPVNTGPARIRGYELALAFELTDYVRLSGNVMGLDAKSETTGLALPGRPDIEASFRAEIGDVRVWKGVVELLHTGEIPISPSGARLLPARSVWNLSASLNLAELWPLRSTDALRGLWLVLSLNNVSDVAVRDLLYLPQPGRNGHIGVEVEW